MKKLILSFAMAASFSMLSAAESTFDIKAGAGYMETTEKTGLDMALTMNIGIHKMFALGIEPGFHWQKFDEKVGTTTDATTGKTVDVVVSQDVFMAPLMFNPTLRFPNASIVTPYVGGGVGYAWVFSNGTAGNFQYDGGPITQVMAGAQFALGGGGDFGGGSALNLLVEGGFRMGKPTSRTGNLPSGTEFDLTGWFVRGGIRFSLGGKEASF